MPPLSRAEPPAAPDDAPPPPPFSARLDARGGVVLVGAGGGAGADAVAEYAAPPGDWADLYRLRAQGGAPLALGVEPDEAAVDAAEALAEAGFDVRDARLQLARLAGAARTAGAPAPASAALCSHVDFRRVAAQTRHYEPLCGAGW